MEVCIVVVGMGRGIVGVEDIVVVRVEDIVVVRVEGIVVVGIVVVDMGNMGREDNCKDKVEEPDFGFLATWTCQ